MTILTLTSALLPAGVATPQPSAAEPIMVAASTEAFSGAGDARLQELFSRPPSARDRGDATLDRAGRSRPRPATATSSAPGGTPSGTPSAAQPAGELQPDEPPAADPVQAEAAAEAAPEAAAHEPITFATVAGTPLVHAGDLQATVGFHESGDSRSLALDPVGTATDNYNIPRYATPEATADNRYLIMPSRLRANGATSAVDLRVEPGVPVTSPVTGTVEKITEYRLYGRTPDLIVEIVPEGRPDLRVRMLHVDAVVVAEGEPVEAGVTVVAGTSRQLPFRSQIDRFGGRGPHVHVEVHPRDTSADE